MLEFIRQLNQSQREDLRNLQESLGGVTLSDGPDSVSWAVERSGKYSKRSLYKMMTSGGVVDFRSMLIWKCVVPLKVRIFLWMANHDRIQCGVQLKKKEWSGPEQCFVCDELESTDHILFQCPLAIFLWSFLRDCLSWPMTPTGGSSLFLEIVQKCRGKNKW